MNIFDDSKKTIISEPIIIGDDNPVIKYRAESDGRTFWAYNGMEVFYDNERMYAALDHIAALKKQVQELEKVTRAVEIIADWHKKTQALKE